ncbi:MAG: hypothetical protein ACWGQW_02040 [bacterium]
MGNYYFSEQEVPGSIQLSEKTDSLKQRLCTLVNRQGKRESLLTRMYWAQMLLEMEAVIEQDEQTLELVKKSVDTSS